MSTLPSRALFHGLLNDCRKTGIGIAGPGHFRGGRDVRSCGQNQFKQVTKFRSGDILASAVVGATMDDHQIESRGNDQIMSVASFDAESVVAQVNEGNKVAVQRSRPKVPESADRTDLRVGVYALINPAGWNNLLVTGPEPCRR